MLGQVFSADTEDEVYSTLFYPGGVTAQLSVNWSDESYRKMSTKVTLWGTKGRIVVDRQECQVYLRDTATPAGGLPARLERALHDRPDPSRLVLRARRGVQRRARPLRAVGVQPDLGHAEQRPELVRLRRGHRPRHRADDPRRRVLHRQDLGGHACRGPRAAGSSWRSTRPPSAPRRGRHASGPARALPSASAVAPDGPHEHRHENHRRESHDGPAAVRGQPVLRGQPHVRGEGAGPGHALPGLRQGDGRARHRLRRRHSHLHVHDARAHRRGRRPGARTTGALPGLHLLSGHALRPQVRQRGHRARRRRRRTPVPARRRPVRRRPSAGARRSRRRTSRA